MRQSLWRCSAAGLKTVFDQSVKSKISKAAPAGLFGNPYLTSPKGLKKFSNETLQLAKSLTTHLLTASKPDEYIRDLDRLSDMLCRVIDLCEFIRVTHPDSKYVSVAEDAHNQMFEYMNVLNTSKDLYTKLENVLNTPKVWNQLSEEEKSVGKLLYVDFKKSGIDMDDESKSQFVQLSSYISQVGQEFNNGVMQPKETQIVIPRDQFKDDDINPNFKSFTSKGWDGSLKIPIYGHAPYGILNSTPNKFIRKSIWCGLHSVPDSQIGLLNGLLKGRAALARLMGFNDYAEYSLEDKMVHSSKNVNTLLEGLAKNLEPLVAQEIQKLDPSVIDVNTIKPWDREFMLSQYLGKQRSTESVDLTQYFSLGTVIQGLSDLFQSIYGIKFIPSTNGEVWHPMAHKLDAIDSNGVKIGNLYLDLFERSNKTPHPAHFTVVCSRQIPQHELDDPFAWKEKTVETIKTTTGEIYQLPSVCLVCNYHADPITGMTFLTLNQISTLFHEMGHAMHSLLGRTKLHNVSGTRCVTDFVELPSILNETFAQDERVLCKIGKHWSTGESIEEHLPLLRRQLQNEKILKHSETYSQVKMAQLDLLLHSDLIFQDGEFDIVKIYHGLEARGYFSDDVSNWPGKFGHLFTYGALYYSYLLDRALATKVWNELFEKDPFSREAGDLFRKEVLEWGGSRDPWDCVRGVLKKSDIDMKDFVKVL